MSTQFLRGTTENIAKSTQKLLPGQPLYDQDRNMIIMGGGSSKNINECEPIVTDKLKQYKNNTHVGSIEFGAGDNSIQLSQSAGSFTYTSSGSEYTYQTATTGKDALNLSSLGRVTRNGYAVVGSCNTVEYDANNKLDEDDGGIIAGYKNYTNTRGSSIFGAHNRLLDTKNSFILGYQNTLYGNAGDGSSSALIVGSKNYMQSNTRHSAMIGYGLKNNTAQPFQYHFGTWNDPGDQNDRLRFTIGNGTDTGKWIYQDVQLGTPETRPKPTLQECISNNEKLKYNPNKEGWRYIKVGNSYQLITSTTSQTDFDNSLVYQYINAGRSNAFQISSDGRAQLFRQEVAQYGEDGLLTDVIDYTPLVDNDLLTKKEIEEKDSTVLREANSYTDTKIGALTKSDVDLGNVDNKSVSTIKSEFTGSISLDNTGFVTGGDVYTELNKKVGNSLVDTNTKAYLNGSDISNGSIGSINASRMGPVGVLSLTCSNPNGSAMTITLDETFKPIGNTSIIVNRQFRKDDETGSDYSDIIMVNLYSNAVGEKPSLWIPSKEGYILEQIQIYNQLVMLKIN